MPRHPGHSLAFAFAFASALAACTSTTEPEAAPGTYFELEFVNFAWEPTWHGLVIDSTGAVHRFDLGGTRWAHADEEFVSAAALAEKWQRERERTGRINLSTFDKLSNLLRAAQSQLASTPRGCADAGVLTYSGYRWDPERNAFQRVVVRREGDVVQLSTSSAGRELASRLVMLELRPTIPDCQPEP